MAMAERRRLSTLVISQINEILGQSETLTEKLFDLSQWQSDACQLAIEADELYLNRCRDFIFSNLAMYWAQDGLDMTTKPLSEGQKAYIETKPEMKKVHYQSLRILEGHHVDDDVQKILLRDPVTAISVVQGLVIALKSAQEKTNTS